MKPALRTHTLTQVASSDEFRRFGQFYVTESLSLPDEKKKPHEAVILKCPFCSLDMASMSFHKILWTLPWWGKLLGLKKKLTIKIMLQCPYNPSHRFTIKNGKVKRA